MKKTTRHYRVGERVRVYEDVIDCTRLEGEAIVVSFEGLTGSADVGRYQVRFHGELDPVARNIRFWGNK